MRAEGGDRLLRAADAAEVQPNSRGQRAPLLSPSAPSPFPVSTCAYRPARGIDPARTSRTLSSPLNPILSRC